MKKNESGRSMVEMLGVLAIIGVLSVGGIAGYTLAMNKYRVNEATQAIALAAVVCASGDEDVDGFQNDFVTALACKEDNGARTLTYTLAGAVDDEDVGTALDNLPAIDGLAIEAGGADPDAGGADPDAGAGA